MTLVHRRIPDEVPDTHLGDSELHARLSRNPWPSAAAFVAVTGGLLAAGVVETITALLFGMLAAAAVAIAAGILRPQRTVVRSDVAPSAAGIGNPAFVRIAEAAPTNRAAQTASPRSAKIIAWSSRTDTVRSTSSRATAAALLARNR